MTSQEYVWSRSNKTVSDRIWFQDMLRFLNFLLPGTLFLVILVWWVYVK